MYYLSLVLLSPKNIYQDKICLKICCMMFCEFLSICVTVQEEEEGQAIYKTLVGSCLGINALFMVFKKSFLPSIPCSKPILT